MELTYQGLFKYGDRFVKHMIVVGLPYLSVFLVWMVVVLVVVLVLVFVVVLLFVLVVVVYLWWSSGGGGGGDILFKGGSPNYCRSALVKCLMCGKGGGEGGGEYGGDGGAGCVTTG